MAKYASWAEFERNVPLSYKESATPEAYRRGMNGIAPPGTSVKEGRVRNYGTGVEDKSTLLVERYRRAMFE